MTGNGQGRGAADQTFALESCHSVWFFEPDRGRFRRFMKGLGDALHPRTEWRPYYGVDVDPVSESFVVLLDPDGDRLLRSWLHGAGCARCGEDGTAELKLDDVRLAARG